MNDKEIIEIIDKEISDGCATFMFCKHDILKALIIQRKEILDMIERLKLDDDFHKQYKELLGEDDLLVKTLDLLKKQIEGEEK